MPNLSATIDGTGISAPTFADIQAGLFLAFQNIYGVDSYLAPDSQDGQLLSIFAAAIKDANDLAIATYQAFSPATAQGNGLSTMVKINGLKRLVSTNSTAGIRVVGVPGTQIFAGLVSDGITQWKLPPLLIIPAEGEVLATAVATTLGDYQAAANTINQIVTPTAGWQSATNPSDAEEGQPVETDATLRRRQSFSTSQPAQSPIDALIGAVANLTGVETLRAYENDTNVTDSNGIPSHTISLVIDGGLAADIANTIALRKTPGTGTFGDQFVVVIDQKGMPERIRWFNPIETSISVAVTIRALTGYVSTTGTALVQAISDYINSLGIGEPIYLSKVYVPADLSNEDGGNTYNVLSIKINRKPAAPDTTDLIMAFNEMAQSDVADIVLTISSS